MPTQTRKAAAPDKGAAALAEKAAEPKTLDWNGIDLTLPATMPTMGITAAWRHLERAAEAQDGMATMGYLVDMVDVLVGGRDDLAAAVWAKIDADGTDAFEAVLDLVDAAGGCYGVEPGESSASR